MEGTEQADEAPEAETTTSEAAQDQTAQSEPESATTEAQPRTMEAQTTADEPQPEATADQPQSSTDGVEPQATADEPQAAADEPQATVDEPQATADQPQATADGAEPQATAEALSEGPDTASDNPQDAAEDGRPLGAADEMADMVDQAVDRMNEGIAEEQAEDAEAAAAPVTDEDFSDAPAADETATADETDTAGETATANAIDTTDAAGTADVAAAPTSGNGAAPDTAETDAAVTVAAKPAPPAPRVYEGPEPTTMEELLAEQTTEIRSLKHGDVVEGTVVRIDKDEILVDIGAKSEGVISNRELYGRNAESQPQLSIGDVVLVYVLQPESPEGHAVLSLRRAGLERKWRSMQEQLDAGAIIEAPVIDHNKGGLIVDCGIRGFVPISQIVDFPRRPQNEQPRDAAQEIAEKLQPYVGRKLRLKILEVNRKANRLILSEKVALYEERREKRDELFSSLQVGQKVTGTVRSIAPFGVFVDLGGIDGLVHKSELSWNKVNNPEAGYHVGEEVEAEVIDINHERGRISLSIRRLQPDPWHSTVADLKVGDLIDGTVTKIVNFGSFVRVRDGLEGLIHISELSHQRVNHPGDVVHEGQTLKLKIISLDQERHRLGLSLKQAEEAPARPEPSTSTGTGAARERRPRQERGGYDASQAVQEPEGGIDNTLAAAFAQVRQQMEETEAAQATAEAPAEPVEVAGAEILQDLPEPEIAPETAAAKALEVGPAEEPESKPPRKTRASAKAKAEPEAAAKAESETPPAEATAEAPPAEATAEPEAAAEPAAPAESAAEPEAPAEATAEAATAAAAEPEAAAESKAAAESAAEPESPAAEAPAEPEAAAEPETVTAGSEPAEGGSDTAPAEGADTEEPTA
jgi:small subunit ribosomal protein S1